MSAIAKAVAGFFVSGGLHFFFELFFINNCFSEK